MLRFLMFFLTFLFATEAFPAEEIRAIWVARWDYTKGSSAWSQKKRIREIFERAAESGFNAVFFQVRGRADAFYKSSYEPWAMEISGDLGGDPGWDPLQFAIGEAKNRGVEIHAWINVCTIWSGTIPPPSDTIPLHIWWAYPEWILGENGLSRGSVGYSFINPSIPEVRRYITSVVSEIAERYHIDGIHLDYIRYPGPGYPYDSLSNRFYRDATEAEPGLSRDEWRRRQVTELVRSISRAVWKVKPGIKISAAVLGRYSGFPGSWNGYNSVYQDGKAWLEEGLIDFVVPMIYNPRNVFSLGDMISDWVHGSHQRPVCAGIDIESCNGFHELSSRISMARTSGASGIALFGYDSMEMRNWWDKLAFGNFLQYAAVPRMHERVEPAFEGPKIVAVRKIASDKTLVIWIPPDTDRGIGSHSRYNIYRSTSYPVDPGSSGTLLHTTSGRINFWIDSFNSWSDYYYAVSALNDNDIEGPLFQQQPPVGKRSMEAGIGNLRVFPLEEEGIRIEETPLDAGVIYEP